MTRKSSRTVTLSAGELKKLYAAKHFIGSKISRKVSLQLPFEIYSQDPLVARENPTLAPDDDYFVAWEPELDAGPTSARFAVVDFDADTGKVHPPVQWDDDLRAFIGSDGEKPSHRKPDDPQFHQVLIWAILQRALQYFEEPTGLGRSIPWGFEGNRLIVVPHAGYGKNAYYDRKSKSIQFYYFGDSKELSDTCLSADIVHHEFGHAVLDGIRPLLTESSSTETRAFHEAIGDITAILMALRNNTLRKKLARQSEGNIQQAKAISSIAEEFGRGVSDKPYLRSASNCETMSTVAGSRSPYQLSLVLTGAVFDILVRFTRQYSEREKSPAEAFWYAADRMQRTVLQPLDLLPPMDVTFRDYALAMLRAEALSNPLDPHGYRAMMIDVFEAREILSAEECSNLRENGYLFDRPRLAVFHSVDRIASSKAAAYRFLDDNRRVLGLPRNRDVLVADLYSARKRTRQGNRLPRQLVLQYFWREEAPLDGADFGRFKGRTASFLCGGTMVFDERDNLQWWCRKDGGEAAPQRRAHQLAELATRIRAGQIGEEYSTPIGLLGTRMPLLSSREVDGVLRFESLPHLHLSDPDHRDEGERQWEISS